MRRKYEGGLGGIAKLKCGQNLCGSSFRIAALRFFPPKATFATLASLHPRTYSYSKKNDKHHRQRFHHHHHLRRPSARTPRRRHRLHPPKPLPQKMCVGWETLGPTVSRAVIRTVHSFVPGNGTVDDDCWGESTVVIFVCPNAHSDRSLSARLDESQLRKTYELLW